MGLIMREILAFTLVLGKGFNEKPDFIIFLKLLQITLIGGQDYRLDSVKVKQLAFRIDGVFFPKNVK